jgi:carboxyl-terminal processing protease
MNFNYIRLISLTVFLFALFSRPLLAQKATMSKDFNRGLEKIIGNKIKSTLETYHFRNMRIDDSVSQKAFKEFVKRMDYSKQFLLKSDIKAFEKYQFQMDDQMVTGEHKLVKASRAIYEKRVNEAEKLREKIFKKQFSFGKKEKLELDPEKRGFASSKKEWEENWKKTYKHEVLNRYVSYLNKAKEEADPKKKKNKSKKSKKKKEKSAKKMTDKEMRKKAHDGIEKKYKRFFARIKKNQRMDYLEKFFNSIGAIYDPHTVYFPPKKKEDFDIDISGQLEGIGAVLQEDGPYIKVVKVVPGGAAWRQKGLEADDVILMVGEGSKEPVDLVDMRVDDAVRYIRGKKGTEVRLTVKKSDASQKVIPIIRDVVQVDASYAKSSVLDHKDIKGLKIGYIFVPKFYRNLRNAEQKNCTKDVREELERLKSKKVDGIILDLRNNGGGALEDARQMSGLFIDKGPIVQIKGHAGDVEVLRDFDSSITYDGPLIVMMNQMSASASEILAGAMQDYGRAVIVGGEYSHGKGTVQGVANFVDGPMSSFLPIGGMKVTSQKFYRISGVSTQYKGITPDIILPDPYGHLENREQDMDYSLPWDKVAAQNYKKWGKYRYDIGKLKKLSGKRIKKNKRFQKIVKSVEYLKKRKDDTLSSLNLKETLSEDKKNKEIYEKLKSNEELKKLRVSNFEESLRSHEDIRKGDEKLWKKDLKQREDDWVESLRKDPGVEEAMFIMDDIIKQLGGKKIVMVK